MSTPTDATAASEAGSTEAGAAAATAATAPGGEGTAAVVAPTAADTATGSDAGSAPAATAASGAAGAGAGGAGVGAGAGGAAASASGASGAGAGAGAGAGDAASATPAGAPPGSDGPAEAPEAPKRRRKRKKKKSSPSPPPTPEMLAARAEAEAIKKDGNAMFMRGEYAGAEAKYTEALALDPTNKFLLGNRSAARRSLKKFDEALADANDAIKHNPDWAKGYYRQAEALLSLNKPREAATACSIAHRLDPSNMGIKKQMRRCLQVADNVDRTITIESIGRWTLVFQHIRDMRQRLAVLAHFWNESRASERFGLFQKFMEVMSADTQEILSRYRKEQMIKLPLHNYQDVAIPPTWLDFYKKLSPTDKAACFRRMWDLCSSTEQNLIVRDMDFFFRSKMEEGHDVAPEPELDDSDPVGEGGGAPAS